MPVFQHAEADLRSFRMITSQFCVTGWPNKPRSYGPLGSRRLRSYGP
jgi:hypothetical protein